MFQKPFSFNGSIKRTEYGISIIIWIVIALIINHIALLEKSASIAYIFFIPLYWFLFAQGAKRCHDIGKSGWFQLIPFYIFWMIFADSIKGENEYGPYAKEIDILQQKSFESQGKPRKGWKLAPILLISGSLLIIVFIVKAKIYQSKCFERLAPNVSLCNCSFEGKDLSNRDLHGTDFSKASFYKGNLKNVNFKNTNLTDANLSESNLTNVILTGVTLDGANLQGAIGLNDEILCNTFNVPQAKLPVFLSSKKIRLESEEIIGKSLKNVCSDIGVSEAAIYKQDSSFHPVVLYSFEDSSYSYNSKLPEKFQPMAYRYCELVACIEEDKKVLFNTCSYTNGSVIERYQYQTTIVLRIANTAEIIDRSTFFGSEPGTCPVSISSGRIFRTITGSSVDFNEIREWLKDYVNPPE